MPITIVDAWWHPWVYCYCLFFTKWVVLFYGLLFTYWARLNTSLKAPAERKGRCTSRRLENSGRTELNKESLLSPGTSRVQVVPLVTLWPIDRDSCNICYGTGRQDQKKETDFSFMELACFVSKISSYLADTAFPEAVLQSLLLQIPRTGHAVIWLKFLSWPLPLGKPSDTFGTPSGTILTPYDTLVTL